MVDLSVVHESNESLRSSTSTSEPTALFVGATSGVGESTVKQLAKYTIRPTVFLVGRNETAASSIISELKSINPQGDFKFIKSDVSLIKNVDSVCDEVKQKTDKLDILFMSQGYQTFAGRTGEIPTSFIAMVVLDLNAVMLIKILLFFLQRPQKD